jgi:anti-sigma factor RsiW
VSHPLHDLGAYALGALPEDEEATVRAHLATCMTCRDEHARLAALRPLLDLAEQHGLEGPALEEPSPLLEEAVLAGFAAERGGRAKRDDRGERRRRFGLPSLRVALPSAALGAALAVAVLALAGVFADGGGGAPSMDVDLRGAAGSAHAVLRADEAGTVITLDAKLPPSARREHYEVLMLSDGYELTAGTFRVGSDGRVTVDLACGGRPDAYDTIVIRRDDDTILTAELPA